MLKYWGLPKKVKTVSISPFREPSCVHTVSLTKERDMKYLTLMVTDKTAPPYIADDDNIAEWVNDQRAAGRAIGGDRLRPPQEAKTVRVRNGEVLVTDGPFTEGEEYINGFDVLEFTDLDEAIEVMAQHPVARFGQIDIRPFFDWEA
jgi:hypothetical protein